MYINNMSYYNPNFYLNYPYTNNNQFNNYNPSPQFSLNGKIVDSEDMVKAADVPIGGFGLFPKADLSEIYIKTWNQNGTTSITTFKPSIAEIKEEPNTILEKINILEAKIDAVLNRERVITKETPLKVKEGVKNDF